MITIEVNDRSVLDALERLRRGLTDMTPVMADVAQALASASERQFASQSGPLGPWPHLQDVTTGMRTERGTWPGQMLQVSAGGLAASVQTSHGSNFARIGTNQVYAAMHMFGGTTSSVSMIPGKKIPARPYLPFNPVTQEITAEANQTVLEILEGYLQRLAD